jgi:acyl-coenzyme A thioesterase PaaI-like protein
VQGDAYVRLLDATRSFLDTLCTTDAPAAVTDPVAVVLRDLAHALSPYNVSQPNPPAGNRWDLPGRGHPLQPCIADTEWRPSAVRARITFGGAHHGVGGAVHGGLIPLVYDDLLGHLVARNIRTLARTAYLHVDFKALTPVGSPLEIEANIDRIEGRKIFVTGRMRHGATTTSTSEALFVVVRTPIARVTEEGCRGSLGPP